MDAQADLRLFDSFKSESNFCATSFFCSCYNMRSRYATEDTDMSDVDRGLIVSLSIFQDRCTAIVL